MHPRAQRLACSLRSIDGCTGTYSVLPGSEPRSIEAVEPVVWDRPAEREVQQAMFTLIGEMGMTGTLLLLNQYQWRALNATGLQEPFYAALLWGGNALKVVEDAALLAARHPG